MKTGYLKRAAILSTAMILCGMQAALAYSQAEKDAFIKADTNSDRKISKAEFRTLIAELAATGSEKALKVRKLGVYGYAFKRIDADKDGMITPAELQSQR